jgi:putative tryptophan/tyrosine transport system substrate-binding protein
MMSRRAVLRTLAALPAALTPAAAWAQRPARTPARVGWLSYVSPPDPALENLRAGLQELGHGDSRSYVLVPRFADFDFTRLPALVQELATESIDVLVTRGPSTDYAKAIRDKIPVVFAFSGDPVEAGFAKSLARPGLNMTGITFMALELSAKRVEVLKEMVPAATKIALLTNPEHAGELAEYRVTDEAARRLGAMTTRYIVRTPQELASMLQAIQAARPDAMLVLPDSLTLLRRKEIAEFARQARIPAMYGWTEFAESGGLMTYGPGLTENFKTLARFTDRILKGADANTLPIEQVSRIGLTLNMATARSMGLAVPPSILVRADRVIE